MEFQRQGLERGIEIGAKLDQGLEAGMNKKIIRPEIHQPREKADQYHRDAQPQNRKGRIRSAEARINKRPRFYCSFARVQHTIDNVFERPRLKEAQKDREKSE